MRSCLRVVAIGSVSLVAACSSGNSGTGVHVRVLTDSGAGAGGAGSGGTTTGTGGKTAGSGGGATTGGAPSGGNGGASSASSGGGPGGAQSTGGRPSGGADAGMEVLPPSMRTGQTCNADADCPSGLCLLNVCDAPGCGPTKGITELCDGVDNDCDGIADDPKPCGAHCHGGTQFDGHAYAFCDAVPFLDADAECRSVFMHVARIDSAAEMTFLTSKLDPPQGYWIAGSDLAEVGTWRWLHGDVFWKGGATGTAQNGLFASWGLGQPNDIGIAHVQRCLDLNYGAFNDEDCTLKQGVVCEQYNFPPGGCFDGVRNGDEVDVDCGGSCAPCALLSQRCTADAGCQLGSCVAGKCADTCHDKVKNFTETDVDCGGACARCAPGLACKGDYDCGSRVCQGGMCATCSSDTCPDCDGDYKCCGIHKECGCFGGSLSIYSCQEESTHP